MNNQSKPPLVAVSACLLGQKVRYDGQDKYTPLIAEELKKYCRLLSFCPELEIGLGVPREKIRLTLVDSQISVLKMDQSNEDVTDLLVDFSEHFIKKFSPDGLVLQDGSPSCGVGNTKLYSQAGEQIGMSSGVFAATIIKWLPDLPVVVASQLQNKQDVFNFFNSLK